jgi:phage terminase large subunit-like protein
MGAICQTVLQHRERMQELRSRKHIVYDAKAAEMPIQFLENNVRLYEGDWAGKPFLLPEWQKEDLMRPLFGFKYADGARVFREAYIQLPKGTGKSAFNAGLILFYLLFGGMGLHLYCVGTSRETALTVFNDVVNMYFASPKLKPYLDYDGKGKVTAIYTKRRPRNTLQYVSADTRFDGPRPTFISFDEYHRHKSADLHNIFQKSLVKVRQGLMVTITNAGEDLVSPCHNEYETAKAILAGSLDKERYFAYVPEPDPEDLAEDGKLLTIETLRKVSPNLGYTIQEADVLQELEDARKLAHKRPSVLRYHFNMWVAGGEKAWLDYPKWQECGEDYDETDLYGCPIWLGIDLSKTTDLSAIVGVVEKAGRLYLLAWCYLPKVRIQEAKESEAPYAAWEQEGWITACGERVIDSDVLHAKLQEIQEHFQIKDVGFDRSRAAELIAACEEDEIPVTLVNQSMIAFSDPTKKFEQRILEGTIRHNNNPCLNWQVSNARVAVRDDLIKPVKEYLASAKRIDAVVSAIMALYVHDKDLISPEENVYAGIFDVPANLRSLLGV